MSARSSRGSDRLLANALLVILTAPVLFFWRYQHPSPPSS